MSAKFAKCLTPLPLWCALAGTCTLPVRASDDAALDLEAPPAAAADSAPAEPVAEARGAARPRVAVEAAVLALRRPDGRDQTGHRLGLDLRWRSRLGSQVHAALSDRIDDLQPALDGRQRTRNSLREALVGWSTTDRTATVEAGRINVRHGPAYGFNPSDFLRSGATRTITNADPVAVRENRIGSFMLRGNQVVDGGAWEAVWSPKLTGSAPDAQTWTADLGATNAQHRLLLSASTRLSERWSAEGLALWQREHGHDRWGANLTGLVGDATVVYAEWSYGRLASLAQQWLAAAGTDALRHQAAAGLTYTLSSGTTLSAEWSFNGAGLDRHQSQQLFTRSADLAAAAVASAQANQDQLARRAWLLYATHKGVVHKQLDMAAFLRGNAVDRSTLAWVEWRYHWPRFDGVLQWQRGFGDVQTEYGSLPLRQAVQLIGVAYF